VKLVRRRKTFVIPLNSMSDVAFLLLIFIMLVALMNYRREVKIDYPEGELAKSVNAEKNLEIWVDKAGSVYVDGVPATLKDVENAVINLYLGDPENAGEGEALETRVHIIADRDTAFEHVQGVLEILQLLQYRIVSFVVKDA
jgi:biopolymer transport protein ExbD